MQNEAQTTTLNMIRDQVGRRVYITIPEVMEFSGLSRTTLWRIRRDGKAPCFRNVGGKWMVQVADLAKWLDSRQEDYSSKH